MATTTAETSIDQLDSLMSLIQKAEVNFKKCPKARLTKGYLEARVKIIDEYWSSFHSGHQELYKMTNKEQRLRMSYFKDDKYSECEEAYLNLKADITDMLQSSVAATKPSMSSTVDTPQHDKCSIDVKLPRINLPSYSGAYEEWQSFEDTFTSLIHNNKALSDVQKLHYLKSCLVGEAVNTIKQYQVTERNYTPAWNCLKGRYSQKRLIVNAILKRLFSMKKMTSQSPAQLKALIDNTKECLNSLKALHIVIESWDPLIEFLLVQKLDQDSHKEWENYIGVKNLAYHLPTQAQLFEFLESRICTLELTNITCTTREKPRDRFIHAAASAATTSTTSLPTCKICNEEHFVCHCKEFGSWSAERRSEYARDNRLCYNCLAVGHSVFNCRQKTSCKICGKRHHSLLHSFKKREVTADVEGSASLHTSTVINNSEAEPEVNVSVATHCSNFKSQMALLATAIVPVRNSVGQITMLRALIDMGSQATFVSERATQMLRLNKSPIHGFVTGVGSTRTSVSHTVELEVLSRYDELFNLPVKAFVLSTHLTSNLPCEQIRPLKWSHLEGLSLADPEYFTPGKIDILLGIDVYTAIVRNNLIKGPPGTPCAQETSLGWILFGNIKDTNSKETIVMHHHLDLDVHDMLKNMWDVEITTQRRHTAEEKLCEEIYAKTQSRTSDGRYLVKIPFKTDNTIQRVGQTKETAKKRFYHLEKKFESNHKLKEEYCKVLGEYIELKHVEEVPEEEMDKPAIYLPHHAVVRDDKETTKLRVVFDGSCKGSNNRSLNDEQLVGPQLQEDLRSLILRWRMHPICFVADIQKMYRQICVSQSDADHQRILWRNDITQNLREYRLQRVTFGTSSAPYLAVRTLMQLADDEGTDMGLTRSAKVIKEDFFVDDCMTGFTTVNEAIEVSKELTKVLKKGGFDLQKWASNSTEFMNEITPSLRCANANKDIDSERVIKTLGLTWNMTSDSFQYLCCLPELPKTVSKRNILSDIQRLFDPLGWLAPAIIPAKMLIQKIWLTGHNWDDTLSEDLHWEWLELRKDLERLNKVKIDRWINIDENTNDLTLHGFCDASSKGYCAVVYCRVININGEIKTNIVAAKTRVTPIRPVTIPRLELLGALLLAQLLTFVRDAMRIPKDKIYAWTDSSVVLSWINGDPNNWKTYVSNRVIEILENTDKTQWFHVVSEENPADVGSRGQALSDLINNELWWKGPNWLTHLIINFRKPKDLKTELESKKSIEVNVKIDKTNEWEINIENFDSISELLRVIVYSKRFINSKKCSENIERQISTEELEDALLTVIRISQRKEFEEDWHRLKQNKVVRNTSRLRTLNPYLDEHDIIRVGGRLKNSNLDYSMKHPIILGTKNGLTPLIIADAHKRTLHGGVQLMLCYLRSKYWIIHAKNAVKAHNHRCLVCARLNALSRTQIMGNLPKVRATEARAFLHSGVDFAGLLQIIKSKGRGAKTSKAYIAIFVCMSTKAIHLELVGDLTAESFIGAFQRFVARRGRCTHIWSDNGRTFIRANKDLAEAWTEAGMRLSEEIVAKLASDGTQWHFGPPYSPNFGGLFEAGVKSTKYHLKRILTASLTFEEMTTILCQIEACLNSRPLIPIDSGDPTVEPLTPGHFLIGEAPVIIPNPDLRNININRLSRWQLTQKLVRDFWHTWQSEYLTSLQERPKWMKFQKELDIGDIVLIKDEQLPPGKWLLGRIVKKHPGNDGITRVYSIKSNNNIVKRSLSKICVLPIEKS